ncbi:MAG: cobalamin-dependent protein [Actinobacteria bacterium]|nr:cobalamin-dependent protein [Actinomycetota bacterium]
MSQQLVDAIIEMREDEAMKITDQLISNNMNPQKILEACRKAMDIIGQKFETGEYFIPELILAGNMLAQISEKVKPLLNSQSETSKKLGKIIFGTVEGDIHDIAKNIVVFMLDINGFEVMDLGVDVPSAKFVEAVKETGATIVGLSGFLTMAYDPMKETVQALKKAGLDKVKVMIGGGQIDENVCNYTGATAFGRDAITAIKLAKEWI